MENLTNVLGNLSATKNHLAKVEASLFEVKKFPLAPLDMPSFFKAPKEIYGIYKSNGGDCLGVMGSQFEPMQPKEFFDNILSTVHEFGADLDLETLKFREWANGSKIEFSIKMHPISFKNNKGIDDITNLEVTFATSFDGSKANTISLFTERLICLNGMVANKLQGSLKNRNTIGGKAQILSYASELAQIINGTKEFKEKMEALDKVKLTKKQIEEFKKNLLGYNKKSLLASEEKTDRKYKILFKRTGKTAFGILQGVTYYTNHLANNSKKVSDDEYIRFNQGFKTNSKAQELVFAMLE
jgi:hypothetical protein